MDVPVFVCDWDGTLVSDYHYPEQGEWLPGAVEALRELLKHGEVLIYTMRVSPYERYYDGDERYRRTKEDVDFQLLSIYNMLDAEGLHEVRVHTTLGKPAATYYIDNQAIEFRGGWGEVLSRVLGEPGTENSVTAQGRSGQAGDNGAVTPAVGPPGSPSTRRLDRVLSEPSKARPGDSGGLSNEGPVTPGSLSIRSFPTGATRDTAGGKLAYEGFFSPLVLQERARFMHKHKRAEKIKGRGPEGKAIVAAVLERGGKVRAKVVENRRKSELQKLVRDHVEAGSNLYSDALKSYEGLDEFQHEVVDHAVEYVREKVHTNGCENFWSLTKRMLNGTYVSVEPFHLFRYLDEQSYRFNNRKLTDAERFDLAVKNIVGKCQV